MTDEVDKDAIIAQMQEQIDTLTEQKNAAYTERNMLVAFLSKIYPSWLGRHEEGDETWEPDWMNIVFVESPAGQLSWHIHDSEMSLFSHLQADENREWDGHDTEEKYNRLSRLPAV